jgi:hypothetical protein
VPIPRKEGNAMKKDITPAGIVAAGIEAVWEDVAVSFDRFCLTAGVATLAEMMERDAAELCGPRHGRNRDRRGYRWGRLQERLSFAEIDRNGEVWEYAALATSLANEILTLGQLYRDRADCDNAIFLADSYGYRPGKSALDAVGVTRKRCWEYDWVLEFDSGLRDGTLTLYFILCQ